MNRKDLMPLIVISVVAAIFSFIISGIIFKPTAHKSKAPTVQAIKADFPDIKNDSTYKSVFYDGALDPTQPVQIGSSSNSTPFNSGQ